MNEGRRELTEHLELIATFQRMAKHHGFFYAGYADFLLQEAHWWEPRPPFPARFWRGAPRACFGNALIAAVVYGLRYVEGYATAPVINFPVHHAWNATASGEVIDVTWQERVGLAYFGLEFSIGRADDAIWNGDSSIIDDWRRSHPLLRTKWQGEDPNHHWPTSPRIKLINRRAKAMKEQWPISALEFA